MWNAVLFLEYILFTHGQELSLPTLRTDNSFPYELSCKHQLDPNPTPFSVIGPYATIYESCSSLSKYVVSIVGLIKQCVLNILLWSLHLISSQKSIAGLTIISFQPALFIIGTCLLREGKDFNEINTETCA